MSDDSQLFNRPLYRMRRTRRAQQWGDYNFLKREASSLLADKLADIARRFPLALDLGSHAGELAEAIAQQADKVIRSDFCPSYAPDVVCDEEFLPFAEGAFDLVASALSLHHVNDLPGTFIQIRHCLKDDGLFMAVLPGANTLRELRESASRAAAEQDFPLLPRFSPLVEIRDAGALLQRAGFALPVLDTDTLTVEYESVWKLFSDLRGMGESNVLHAQHKALGSRAQLAAIGASYEKHFSEGGLIPATFEFITLTGWKPHSSQQQPAKRGSGRANLKQVL